MAPKRGSASAARPPAKRAAPADAPASAARRAKTSQAEAAPEDPLTSAVAVLDSARSMSETGREMLRRMLRGALGTAPAERHPYQAAVADMLLDASSGAEADLTGAIREAEVKVGEAQAARVAQDSALAAAREALTEQGKVLEKCKLVFRTDNKALQLAGSELRTAAQAKAKRDEALHGKAELRRALEAALEEHYPQLLQGEGDTSKNVDCLLKLASQLQLEDSLVSAFTVAARMPPAKRGAFDRAALGQLGPELERHSQRLAEPDPDADAQATACASEEAAASAAMDEARARQRSSAEQLRFAEVEQREAEGAEGRAEEAVEAAQQQIGLAERGIKRANEDLAAFRAGPLASLFRLHGGSGGSPAGCGAAAAEKAVPAPAPEAVACS